MRNRRPDGLNMFSSERVADSPVVPQMIIASVAVVNLKIDQFIRFGIFTEPSFVKGVTIATPEPVKRVLLIKSPHL